MAQAGYTPILIYASGTATNVPAAGDLTSGASGAELAINYADGKLYYKDGSGNVQLIASKAGASGDVVGPSSATDNAIVRFDGTTGKLVQNSVVTIADSTGDVAGVGALTMGGNLTLSGGTANGVLYLNGSKVATSGSALTFDGLTLVNSQGSSGTSIAGNALLGLQGTSNSVISFNVPDANAAGLFFGYGGNPYWAGIEKDGSTGLKLVSGGSTLFTIAGSEQMRLTSTGLGIGTSSPATRLQIGDATVSASNKITLGKTTATTEANLPTVYAGSLIASGTSVDLVLEASSTSGGVAIRTAGSTRAVIDSSGNLGLGVTPSASTIAQFEGGSNLILVGRGNVYAGNNVTYNGGWKYIATAVAAQYNISGAEHRWYNAPSGTAGNTISWTQALTLDANRNLLLNGTTAGASAVGTLAIFNGTAPTGSVTNGIILYAEDVSSSSELKVRDEAGNVTTLSPHNFSLIPEGPSEDMAWAYYSEKGGKRINVDMLKLARMVEKLTGEKLVYES